MVSKIRLESVGEHLKKLCKNPKFKKEYLKEKKKLWKEIEKINKVVREEQ